MVWLRPVAPVPVIVVVATLAAIPPVAVMSPLMTVMVPPGSVMMRAVWLCHVVRHRSHDPQLGVSPTFDSIIRVPDFVVTAVATMLVVPMVVTAMVPFFTTIVLAIPVTAVVPLAAMIFTPVPVVVVVVTAFVPPGLVFEFPPALLDKRSEQRRAHEPKTKIPYMLSV